MVEHEDHFQLFLFLAFLFLMGETLWSERQKKWQGTAVLSLLAFFLFSGFLDSPRSLVQKGNRNVQEKKYQSAVENYRKAEVASPENPVVRYNLGTALYHLYEYRDAERELEQALNQAKDPAARAHVLYNYGNTKYRLGDFEKAIDAYKKVLDLNPKDPDAKYNLEFLKKKKSEFEKKQQDRQNQQQNQQQQNQQQQQQQSQNPSQSEQQQNQQDQSGGKNQQKEPQPQQDQEQKSEGSQTDEGQSGKEQDQKQDQQPQNPQPDKQEMGNSAPQPQGEEKPDKGEQQNKEKQQKQNESQQKEQGQGQDKQENQPQASEGQQPQKQPLQGQMSKENALRILEALRDGEKELQDLRRPRTPTDASEPEKDW